MPRRAVRKLPTDLDLARNYRELAELTAPLDPAALFAESSAGPDAPLEIEIGSGKGLFLQNACVKWPERNFLGNELAFKYARYAGGRLTQHGRTNALMIHGDGLLLLREFVLPGTAAAVHVYFPDPWWKSRHKKRRVLNESFLADVERALRPGGILHFWTDVQEYYETTVALIQTASQLSGPLPVPEPPATHDLDYRTHFERRTRRNNEPVFRAEFWKRLEAGG